jgi:hypothetical protein
MGIWLLVMSTQWVTPTLDPEELDKRIQELKSVQFWLDQNAKALSATIQAMEVQRMTLSTLQSMNVGMADVAAAMTGQAPKADKSSAKEAAPMVDPMQWWGALTQQFSELAATALKDSAAEAAALVASAAVAPEAKAKAKAKKASRSEPPSGQPVARKAASRSARRGAAASPRKPAARTPR